MSNQWNRRLLFGTFWLAIVVLSGCGLQGSSTGNGVGSSTLGMPGTGMMPGSGMMPGMNESPLQASINGDVSFSADIQPIFNNRCIRCHNPIMFTGMLDLTEGTSYDSLVDQPTSPTCWSEVLSPTRVVPSVPELSMLWRKTMPTADRCRNPMPLGTQGLGVIAPDEFALLEMWIVQGAQNN